MESRKINRQDIDKVRNIEGFPNATDADLIALSNAPLYTACPNPYVGEFVAQHGSLYDEENDQYQKEPFAADVSEGRSDAIYNIHSYHTKVPHKAIMRYILHYTNPGDIVFDGFCGTGMTGVAAQMCESPTSDFRMEIEHDEPEVKWGGRYAIISDLSPAATFIAANYNIPVDSADELMKHCEEIFSECENEFGWMYKTRHVINTSEVTLFDVVGPSKEAFGEINYVIWSDAFICPTCGKEFVFWDLAVDKEAKTPLKEMKCDCCGSIFKKTDCEHSKKMYYDHELGKTVSVSKQVPVMINYSYMGQRYDKEPDEFDLEILDKIENLDSKYKIPVYELPEGYNTEQPKKSHGFYYVHQFYTRRNLFVMAFIMAKAETLPQKEKLALFAAVKSSLSYGTKMVKVNVSRMLNGGGMFALGAVTGTLYIPSNNAERPILDAIRNKIVNIVKSISLYPEKHDYVLVSTGSLTDISHIQENCIDYIFTDPPFGDNLNYSELNFLWEAWQKVMTSNKCEAIMNPVQGKGLNEYQSLMLQSFKECFRILKPNRWMTVEFHNSKNSVWNAIQEALLRAGFVIADVRTLDKQQGSFKQMTSTTAVKQDLVISAYKPKDEFRREFFNHAGHPETAWSFVSQHLRQIPIVVINDGKIEIVSERQAFLLFDRMVAYHIMHGMPVPLDATDFYQGLDEKYIKRDGMFFLPDQVNEYDTARIKNDVEPIQFSLFVTNEKSAIAWLYQQLSEEIAGPQTYAELQLKFMQEVKAVDKFEALPELKTILEENFLQDEKGKWYIPDITKEGDVAKLREKNLLKEFEGYLATKGKLKLFRSEAIRVGFAKLWKEKNYKTIVELADRLPEATVQEDPNILMYYDISLSRI